jgi:hypothetical protein
MILLCFVFSWLLFLFILNDDPVLTNKGQSRRPKGGFVTVVSV